MGGPQGADLIERIDAKMDELPGMAGMHLMRRAVAKFGVGPGAVGHVSRWQVLKSRVGFA
jgi:hypothetical protein